MGCINKEKLPSFSKGGAPKKLPEVNRVIGIDRLEKQVQSSKRIGKRNAPMMNNFGRMSKFR